MKRKSHLERCDFFALKARFSRASRLSATEQRTGVAGAIAEFFFNTQKLIVLGHPIGSRSGTCLDLASRQCNGQVGDGRVFGFATSVTRNARVAVSVRELDRFDGFGQRTDLVHLDQDAIGDSLVDTAL
jgi:hypothetical protein